MSSRAKRGICSSNYRFLAALGMTAHYHFAMRRFFLVAVLAAPLTAQPAAQARYDSAYVAWRTGDYPNALARLERLLSSSDGARFREPIALLTGELYRTATVAPDGANLRWSADGKYASFTTGGGRVSHVVTVDGDSARTV